MGIGRNGKARGLIIGAFGLLTTACSGGGSASGGTTVTPTPTPVATATLTAGATRAVIGEAVSLTWSSANAASCAASGDWSATIGTSGSSNVSFATAGTKTLTLTCGGATASATVTVVAVTSYTVPTNVASITYPASYTTPTARAADLDNPLCGTGLSAVTYPQSWIGRYPLPAVSGAPMASAIQRGIGMKDVWQANNASYVTGCTATARSELTNTFQRIKALGGDYVTLDPWTFIGVNSGGDWYIRNPGELSTTSSTMNDTNLTWAVAEAHRLGLKVHWISQVQGMYTGGVTSVPDATRANVTKFFDAYVPYMVERAQFLQGIGVDVIAVSCQCFTVLEDNAFADIYEAKMAALLPQVRARFSGVIRLFNHPSIMTNATIRNNIDTVSMSLFLNVTAAEVAGLTTAQLRGKFQNTLSGIDTIYHGLSKPVTFEIGAPSRTDYYTTGYLEETFCTSGFNTITGSGDSCIQRSLTTDLSLQAMYYEAYLEAVKAQTLFNTYAVESEAYWLVDGIQPSNTFANLAFSVRSKPAEGILKTWFAR
ncbi:MAG: hypothetical protein KF730_07610 [Sphingomonas sp.]|uniref:glycoside hydrolase family 113 n=1 Tax=Sphingomonas sp. TaxID=28214 RepID=UPI0025E8612D|nr:hypothetical protein [Sphingomonas sp.]MBX3564428.1 hypothetical protein [Sphingomonas sp.]